MKGAYSFSKSNSDTAGQKSGGHEHSAQSLPAVPVYLDITAVAPRQAEALQMKDDGEEKTRQPGAFQINSSFSSSDGDTRVQQLARFAPPVQKKENKTGLPDALK